MLHTKKGTTIGAMRGKIMALVFASWTHLNSNKTNNLKEIYPISIIDDEKCWRQIWTKDEENVGRNFNIVLYIIQLVLFFCNCLQIELEPLIFRFFYTLPSLIISIHLGAVVCACL